MMLDQMGEEKAAGLLERACMSVIKRMDSMNAGRMGMTTSQVGDAVAEERSRSCN